MRAKITKVKLGIGQYVLAWLTFIYGQEKKKVILSGRVPKIFHPYMSQYSHQNLRLFPTKWCQLWTWFQV